MNKICTSLEQSKKLMELGINTSSADMSYSSIHNIGQELSYCNLPLSILRMADDIPAWSLTSLLELMPRIEHLKPFIDLSPNLNSEEVSIYYHSEDSPYIVKDNLIDAAFEMVVWLKENGKI